MSTNGTLPAPFSCAIIGDGTLPIRCGDLLLAAGHRVVAVVSDDATTSAWAREKGLPVRASGDLSAAPQSEPFDYLFSIVNLRILPASVLELPRRGAINYHDGPLPRYAGTHATSWALLQGEARHGITWHRITTTVDAGDILQQREVEVSDTDTALTLNARCYEAAIEAFRVLIEDLAANRAAGRAQDVSARTYFERHRRPPGAGLLDWRRSARELSALVRALDFGPYPNPLGTARMRAGDDVIVVRALAIGTGRSGAEPGRIVAIDDRGLTVATASEDVTLVRLQTIDGVDLSGAEAASRYGWTRGGQLATFDARVVDRVDELARAVAPHESFWAGRLARLEPVVLPQARWAPAVADRAPRVLPVPLEADLATLSRIDDRWTARDVVQAAFGVYLARISGMQAFDLGWQNEALAADVDGLSAWFAPTVPARVDVQLDRSIGVAVVALQEEQRTLAKRRTFLRDVFCRYPDLRPAAGTFAGLSVRVACVSAIEEATLGPGGVLALAVTPAGKAAWVFDPQRLDPADAARMAEEFATLVRGLAAEPGTPVRDLPLLTAEARRQIVEDFNRTARDYPRDRTVAQLVAEQAARTPSAEAATFDRQSLTYQELDRRVSAFAALLQAQGVGRGVTVGLFVERSLDMLVALLGIMRAGGTYVPLDPAFPTERLRFMLEDSGATVLVTERSLERVLDARGLSTVVLDALDADVWSRPVEQPVANPAGPEDLAYVLYTSGSTGKPKGVEISHRALVNFLWSMRDEPGCTAGDALLAVTTLSFDIAGLELFLPLITGARVDLVSRTVAADGRQLARAIETRKTTILQATPATWRMLIESGWTGAPGLKALCGGEALPADLVAPLLARTAELWNMYGPTETTIWSSVQRISDPSAEITVGVPIANTGFHILDEQLQPVPIGVAGELFIGGDGLARGYRGRPELTAEKFIASPFTSASGARLYRTGDLARYRADGQVVCLGRLDHQVKIRGFRIELGDVEAALASHPAIGQAVVVAREDRPGDRRLVAYVVPAASAAPGVGELREHLQTRLPDYMVPSAFVALPRLPLTPNGKVDRKALPAPGAGVVESREFIAPATPVEEAIAAIWAEVLGVPRVGRHDNFFEMGGHSLQATRLIARVEEAFPVELSLRRLFELPTVALMAEVIAAETGDAAGSDDEVVAALLQELEGLSDEQVQALLAADEQGRAD